MPNARIRGGRPNMMKGGTGYSVYSDGGKDPHDPCGPGCYDDGFGNCECYASTLGGSSGMGGGGGNLMTLGACVRCGEETASALAGENPGFTGANSVNCRTCGSHMSQIL